MDIHLLTAKFYRENPHLLELMNKSGRPYGIVIISYNNLRFGIPLRSHIKHKFSFLTIGVKGLDYSKAVLLLKDSYISARPYTITPQEFDILRKHSHFITQKFEHYVRRYRIAISRNDKNILSLYKYSSLQNYHRELGL